MIKPVIIGDCVLYRGNCLEILPTLGEVDACVTDPPYGIKHPANSHRFSGGTTRRGQGTKHAPIAGDDGPFDPSPFTNFSECILWGSNNFHQHLSPGSVLIWLKRNDEAFGSFLSDGEVAWKKGGHGVYAFRHISAGSSKALEYSNDAYAPSAHPTQKPIALMEWCLSFVRGKTILDPYMGSGTTGVACAKMGRKFIGIELDERYFQIACERIQKAYDQPDLFVEPPKKPTQKGMDL